MTECYVGTVTHFRNERNSVGTGSAGTKQSEHVHSCSANHQANNTTTTSVSTGNANVTGNGPPETNDKKEEVVVAAATEKVKK